MAIQPRSHTMSKFIGMITHDDGYSGNRITGALCWDTDRHVMVYPFGFYDVSESRVAAMLADEPGEYGVEQQHVYPV
jgi:hypothetical protein